MYYEKDSLPVLCDGFYQVTHIRFWTIEPSNIKHVRRFYGFARAVDQHSNNRTADKDKRKNMYDKLQDKILSVNYVW